MWLTIGESERLFTQNELIFVTVYSFFILIFCSSSSAKSSGGKKRATSFFGYGASHTLFSATTRKCEQKEKNRDQNVKYQRTFQEKKRNRELEHLKAVLKKKERKIQNLTKKLAEKK